MISFDCWYAPVLLCASTSTDRQTGQLENRTQGSRRLCEGPPLQEVFCWKNSWRTYGGAHQSAGVLGFGQSQLIPKAEHPLLTACLSRDRMLSYKRCACLRLCWCWDVVGEASLCSSTELDTVQSPLLYLNLTDDSG